MSPESVLVTAPQSAGQALSRVLGRATLDYFSAFRSYHVGTSLPPRRSPTWVRTIAAPIASCRRVSSSDLCLYMLLASSGRFSHSAASLLASCSNVSVGDADLL